MIYIIGVHGGYPTYLVMVILQSYMVVFLLILPNILNGGYPLTYFAASVSPQEALNAQQVALSWFNFLSFNDNFFMF